MDLPPPLPNREGVNRRNAVTLKLFFIAGLVFVAFFVFEILASVRLNPVHHGLVGVIASLLLLTMCSAAILRTWALAGWIAGLLAAVHGVLFVVLRMESFALLADTTALFAALAGVMFFRRNIDWHAEESTPMRMIPEAAS